MKKQNLFLLLLLGLLAAMGCEPLVEVTVEQQMEKNAGDEVDDEEQPLGPIVP